MNMSGEKPIDLEELCEKQDKECLLEIQDFEPELNQDLDTKIESEGTDAFYKGDPMFKYIQSEDIIEIYKRIKSALINYGPDIVNKFGYIYQLNLTPGPNQIGDENFVKYYTVDLKNENGSLLLAFEKDEGDRSLVPRADVVFHISEENFVKLYNGNKKTAIEYVLRGILRLEGSYPLTLKFYQDFLTRFVKNPDNFVY